jgi:hypothetical protein
VNGRRNNARLAPTRMTAAKGAAGGTMLPYPLGLV